MYHYHRGPPWATALGRGRRGWLRPLIVSMLSRKPMNGVEIMDEIELITGGLWRPSPGSVYPMLNELLNEDLVRRRDDGRYELTEKGLELAKALSLPWTASTSDVVDSLERSILLLEREFEANRDALALQLRRLEELRDRLDALVRSLEGKGKS